MLTKRQYVLHEKEAILVDRIRKAYVKAYAPWVLRAVKIKPHSLLLEVACGTGAFAQKLSQAEKTLSFILLDVNSIMVRLAAKRLGKACLKAVVSDVKNMRGSITEPVDTILCLNAFDIYVSNKSKFLRDCLHILKPGGKLVFDVSTRSLDPQSRELIRFHHHSLRQFARKNYTGVKPNVVLDARRLQTYEDKIQSCGFAVVRKSVFRHTWSIEEFYKDNVCIPGRSRHVLPNMPYKKRAVAFRYAADALQKKFPNTPIRQSRIFFVLKKPL